MDIVIQALTGSHLRENGLVLDNILICGEEHIKLAALQLQAEGLACLGRALVLNLHHGWRPLLEFQHPVGQCPGGENTTVHP